MLTWPEEVPGGGTMPPGITVTSSWARWRLNSPASRLFRCRSKKTSKLRVTGLCARNSPVTGEFPAQLASNAENVSIWWRHHVVSNFLIYGYVSTRSRIVAEIDIVRVFFLIHGNAMGKISAKLNFLYGYKLALTLKDPQHNHTVVPEETNLYYPMILTQG